MSAKIEKRIRKLAARIYAYDLSEWERAKPPFWRIKARRRWKNRKPDYNRLENELRKVYK